MASDSLQPTVSDPTASQPMATHPTASRPAASRPTVSHTPSALDSEIPGAFPSDDATPSRTTAEEALQTGVNAAAFPSDAWADAGGAQAQREGAENWGLADAGRVDEQPPSSGQVADDTVKNTATSLATAATTTGLAVKDAAIAAKDATVPAAIAAKDTAVPAVMAATEAARDNVIPMANTVAGQTSYAASATANAAQNYTNGEGNEHDHIRTDAEVSHQVPATVRDSIATAGQVPEAASNPSAIMGKRDVEGQLHRLSHAVDHEMQSEENTSPQVTRSFPHAIPSTGVYNGVAGHGAGTASAKDYKIQTPVAEVSPAVTGSVTMLGSTTERAFNLAGRERNAAPAASVASSTPRGDLESAATEGLKNTLGNAKPNDEPRQNDQVQRKPVRISEETTIPNEPGTSKKLPSGTPSRVEPQNRAL